MMSRKTLAWAIAVWTAIAWGGRIAIVFDTGSDLSDRVRISAAVLAGLAAFIALLFGRCARAAVGAYAVVTTVIWIRSVLVVWTGDEAGSFVAVHTVLAAVSLLLAGVAVLTAWRGRRA